MKLELGVGAPHGVRCVEGSGAHSDCGVESSLVVNVVEGRAWLGGSAGLVP